MNAARLFSEFEQLAEAPSAAARLRQFTYDLAVRGRLVEQDPNDSPPVIENSRSEGSSGSTSLPQGWSDHRFGDVLKLEYGKALPEAARDSSGTVAVYGSNGVIGQHSEALTHQPAIIVGRKGSAGALNLSPGASWTTDVAYFLVPPACYDLRFLLIVLKTLRLDSLSRGVKPGLSRADAYNLRIPVPPLGEQHRIVAKVDELIETCDELENVQAERERRRDRLALAVWKRLSTPSRKMPSNDLAETESLILTHFPALIARPDQLRSARQAILDLAVRGRLVPQEPQDEPAAAFLARIVRYNDQRQPRTRANSSEPITVALDVPSSWEVAPLGELVMNRDGDRIPVSKEERGQRAKVYDYYGASGVIDKIDDYLFDKPLLLIGEDGANLVNRSTPIAFIARGKYWVNNHAHVLDAISEAFLRYLELYVNAIDLKPYLTGTAQPKLNQARMNRILVAVPPEAEQHRIVAKVDELMSVCGELERSLIAVESRRAHLLEAVLREVLTDSGAELAPALAR